MGACVSALVVHTGQGTIQVEPHPISPPMQHPHKWGGGQTHSGRHTGLQGRRKPTASLWGEGGLEA